MTPSAGTISPARTSRISPALTASAANIGDEVSIPAVGNARRFVHQRLKIPFGAGHGKILKDRTARIHHSHDDCLW